jgi:Tol biopolymer transport system component
MRSAGRVCAGLVVLALLAALHGCGGDGSGGQSVTSVGRPPAPTPSKIAFEAPVSGQGIVVYTMNTDGSAVTSLGPGQAPAWSPSGASIACARAVSLPGGATTRCIFTLTPTPTGVVASQLTQPVPFGGGTSSDYMQSWSPDGGRIAFARGVSGGGATSLQVVDVGTKAVTPLLTVASGTLAWPDWSPDGSFIAFYQTRPYPPGGNSVQVVRADGSGQAMLLDNARYAAWSPVGSKLVLNRTDAIGMWVADFDPVSVTLSNLRQLASGGAMMGTWSPDGSQVAYVDIAGSLSNPDVFRIGANGSGLTNLTRTAKVAENCPDWSLAVF